jgi:hypothetical protein
MKNKLDMKFIKVTHLETAHKLRYEGFTELPSQTEGEYIFLNNGKKLKFNVEEFGGVYTNILNI